MTQKHVVLLPEVELTTASVLRVTENAVAANLTVIDPATGSALASTKQFYLRGDGSDDDLLQVLIETVQSHAGANTYTGTITWSIDPANPCATVTITRATGSNNFQINWSHASTTLDPLLFGFADADTANDGNPKASTLSPLAAWVSPQPPAIIDERRRYDASVNRARSGRVRGTRRGGPYNIMDLSFALCDSRRVLRTANTSDPAATFMSLLEQVGDGTSFELHLQSVTGTAVDALDVYSRKREYWRFDERSSTSCAPTRLEPAVALYAWDLVAHGYGESLVEPVVPSEPVAGYTLWLDADDASTFTLTGSTVNEWRDKSASAHHMDDDVSSWGAYPTREAAVQNGRAAVRFGNGGAQALEGPVGQQMGQTVVATSPLGTGTIFTVLKPINILNNATNCQDNDFVWGHSNGGYQLALRTTPFRAEFWNQDDAGLFDSDAARVGLVAETDAVVVVTRCTGTNIYISINGGAEVAVASGPNATSLSFPFFLGRSGTGKFYDGYVCELLAYNTSQSADDIAENVAYLRAKWGTP